jgi:hypothetical protein
MDAVLLKHVGSVNFALKIADAISMCATGAQNPPRPRS